MTAKEFLDKKINKEEVYPDDFTVDGIAIFESDEVIKLMEAYHQAKTKELKGLLSEVSRMMQSDTLNEVDELDLLERIEEELKNNSCEKCNDNGGFATMDGWETCTNCL